MRVSQRRTLEDFTCRKVGAYDLALVRLWLLAFIAADRTYERLFTVASDAEGVMTTPLLLTITPVQELRFLLFRHVYDVASAEYHSSLLCEDEPAKVSPQCKRSTTAKRKKRRKKKASSGCEVAPAREDVIAVEVVAGDSLNIGLAPSEVTLREVTATEAHILVLQLLRDTVEEILNNISYTVPDLSATEAPPQVVPVESELPLACSPTPPSAENEAAPPDHLFVDEFSAYSLWLPGGLIWRAPQELMQPGESVLENEVDEHFGFFWEVPSNEDGTVSAAEEEVDCDIVALTTAALRAHTLFYDSQLGGNSAESHRKHSWSLKNRSDGCPAAGKTGPGKGRVPSVAAPPMKHPALEIRLAVHNSFCRIFMAVIIVGVIYLMETPLK